MDLADKALIKLSKAGSKIAFEKIVKKYHPFISRYAYGITGNTEVSADVSQTVFIKLYNGLSSFKITDAKLSTWLCKVAKNLCLNEIKFNKRFVPLEEKIKSQGFEEQMVSKLDLYKALSALDKEHRETFLLVKLNGFSYEEAAEILGIPVGTVRSRIYNARKNLIEELSASYKKEMV